MQPHELLPAAGRQSDLEPQEGSAPLLALNTEELREDLNLPQPESGEEGPLPQTSP